MNDRADGSERLSALHTALVETHQEMLRFLIRRLGNLDEAADVLHDFYVRVLTRIDDVRDAEKLRGWMRRVLETTLIDYYRAQGRRRTIEADYKQENWINVSGAVQDDLDALVCFCIYRLLPTLKPDQADLLWRADLAGEARKDIAESLEITEGNLRVRLHRARQALRQRLEESCRTCPIHGFMDCDCDYSNRFRLRTEQEPTRL